MSLIDGSASRITRRITDFSYLMFMIINSWSGLEEVFFGGSVMPYIARAAQASSRHRDPEEDV